MPLKTAESDDENDFLFLSPDRGLPKQKKSRNFQYRIFFYDNILPHLIPHESYDLEH